MRNFFSSHWLVLTMFDRINRDKTQSLSKKKEEMYQEGEIRIARRRIR